MKSRKTSIFIVDEDPVVIKVMTKLLEEEGCEVSSTSNSATAFDEISKRSPDCVISALMMPNVDGLQLCKQVKETSKLKKVKFIMSSIKAYTFDRKRSYSFGADGYIRKPINKDTFIGQVNRILDDHIDLTFWGVRGTLPATGEKYLKYGGNTSCVSLEFPREQFFIFDGGSGIKNLGDMLMAQGRRRFHAKIFISHPHWDHVNTIPFFSPLYVQGNEIEILGANQSDTTMRELISAQMDGIYFPITLNEFAARVYFRDIEEEILDVGGIEVQTKLLSHPGKCLGYRVNYNGRSICYITDNEIFFEDSEFYSPHYEKRLAKFCLNSDILITDTTYTDEEYVSKVGYGHSCISKVVKLANNAKVKHLCLFHHDPDQDDKAIDRKLEIATSMLNKLKSDTIVLAPEEGLSLKV